MAVRGISARHASGTVSVTRSGAGAAHGFLRHTLFGADQHLTHVGGEVSSVVIGQRAARAGDLDEKRLGSSIAR
ncbi:hypothetical protein ACIGW3_07740 [Streptomyces sp. NPDC053499]|uniref:hypothetical protein n=1 Tax=Streptomyces sp. NPDC053499 TaxID=3365707 RepID=UPI0037D8F502